MSLISEASSDKQLTRGSYATLAGVCKPVLNSVNDIDITSVSQVQTLVWSGVLVASNVINGKVDGTAIAPVTFTTDHATTMGLIADAILAASSKVLSAVVSGNTITVTTKVDVGTANLTEWLVTLGAGQVTATITQTVSPISFLNGLESGLGVKVDGSTVTLATDDATHVVTGDFSTELLNGTRQLNPVGEVLKNAIPLAKKGFVRIACQVRTGEVLVVGDSVSFLNGQLVKKTSETNSYLVELVEDSNCQIAFEA